MSTTTRRTAGVKNNSLASPSPIVNAIMVASALAVGIWLLVERGRLSWPPSELLSSCYTLAGCLALVGPILLFRREPGEGALGELLWMTGGLLLWVYNLTALLRGDIQAHSWATPLAMAPMGMAILAVLLAGWRLQPGSGKTWAWTNVIGWILGLFWVGMGLYALVPTASPSLVAR